MKKNSILAWLGMGAACAACCAPLWLPLAMGAGVFAGGRLLNLPIDAVVCGAALIGILAGTGIWLARRRRTVSAKSCACETSCDAEACGPKTRL